MRIAHIKPAACSVCLQPPSVRSPQPRYVDFEVAYDGPVLTYHGEDVRAENAVRTSIDDLFICEECLKPAAELIGMEDGTAARERIAELEGTVAEQEKEITEKDRAIANLDTTVGHLIDTGVIKRPTGKRPLVGPETHKAQIAELRSERWKAEQQKAKARRKAKVT